MATSSDSSTTVAERNDQDVDLERQKTTSPMHLSKLRMVYDQSAINVEVSHYPYKGSGTEQDPYQVEWIPNDPRNPMIWPNWYKWFVALTNAVSCLSIAFVSSAYTGGIDQILVQFGIGTEVATLGVSLFVLGFAIGPLFWAPLSELYGRQILFTLTYAAVTAFNAGAAASQNIQTLVILRFFAGAFGSSPLTNAGGVIADMFDAKQRGQATTFFAVAPFMGPVLGPIVGSFVGVNVGWRWVEGVMACFTGVLWIFQSLLIPETYGPVLLRRRAEHLSKKTGKHYISILDKHRGKPTLAQSLKVALSRPWALLFQEPIVLLISIYMAIIYGTLYLCFAAFPIVFQGVRGWSQEIASLAFVPVAVGLIIGAGYNLWDNKRFIKVATKHNGEAPPESRLPPGMLGSILLPIGLFWFAWSSGREIHWIMPMIGGAIFGCSIMLVFLSCMNYLIDTYTIYAASVLAANSVLRSLFGAAFPLFTTYMYDDLGVNWAGSIPAFLALACLPFPWLFYKYGGGIRMKCKYSAQAHATMESIRRSQKAATTVESKREIEDEAEQDAEYGPPPPALGKTKSRASRKSKTSRKSVEMDDEKKIDLNGDSDVSTKENNTTKENHLSATTEDKDFAAAHPPTTTTDLEKKT